MSYHAPAQIAFTEKAADTKASGVQSPYPENQNPPTAAEYLGLSISLLAKMRMKSYPRRGPPFAKIGKAVIYRRSDLDAWLEGHVVESQR